MFYSQHEFQVSFKPPLSTMVTCRINVDQGLKRTNDPPKVYIVRRKVLRTELKGVLRGGFPVKKEEESIWHTLRIRVSMYHSVKQTSSAQYLCLWSQIKSIGVGFGGTARTKKTRKFLSLFSAALIDAPASGSRILPHSQCQCLGTQSGPSPTVALPMRRRVISSTSTMFQMGKPRNHTK
jgi:hypothetical protein